MLCMVLLLLCGCAQQSEIGPDEAEADIVSFRTAKDEFGEPPLTIHLESKEDFYSIHYALNLSEDDFLAYLNKRDYLVAVSSKEEALDLMDEVSAVPIPMLSNATLVNCILTPDYENLYLRYLLPSIGNSSTNGMLSFDIYWDDHSIDSGWSRRPQCGVFFSRPNTNQTTSSLILKGRLQGHLVVCKYWETPGQPMDYSAEELSKQENYVQTILKEQMSVVPLVWHVERKISELEMNTLQFQSLEELATFYRSVELDDADFRDYTSKIAWVQDKKDVLDLKKMLSNAPFPLLSTVELEEISINCDIDKLHITYALPSEEGAFLDFDVYYGYRDKHTKTKSKSINFRSTGEHIETGMLSAKTLINGYVVKYTYRPSQALTAKELLQKKTTIEALLQERMTIVKALHSPDAVSSN